MYNGKSVSVVFATYREKNSIRQVINNFWKSGFVDEIVVVNNNDIVVCEPDGTFIASDLERFLVYSKSFDIVLGSRTSLIPSLSSAGMGIIRKFANVLEAKTIEVLFNTNALTDVGCAYKLFTRPSLKRITPLWRIKKSPLFNTELVLLAVSQRINFVEIPITYLKRIGTSAIVDNWLQAIKWAFIIKIYILYYWISWIITKALKKN